MNKELAIECIKTQRQFVDDLTREAFDIAIDLLKQPQRTGRWIEEDDEMCVICSECGEKNDYISAYCPDCGARMEGEGC